MAEKVTGFEGGTAGDNVTAGAGNASGLNTVAVNTGSAKYDPAGAFFGNLGVLITNAAGSNAVLRQLIDAPGTSGLVASTRQISLTYACGLPATVPSEVETYWQLRLMPSAGGMKMAYHTDGGIRLFPATSGATGVQVMSPADRAALGSRKFRSTLIIDASSSFTAADLQMKFYDLSGAQVGSTYTNKVDLVGPATSTTGLVGQDCGRIAGLTNARGYYFDHMGVADGALYEIPPVLARLGTPVVSVTDVAQPSGTTKGTVTVSWPAVSGAVRYDAYRAVVAGTPAQGDFSLYAADVVSPFQFTGQGAGTYHYGIKAVPA